MLSKSDEIRRIIKDEIKKRDLSISQLARNAGLSYDDIRQFLHGRVNKPSYFIMQPLLAALDLSELPPTAPYVGELSAGGLKCSDPFGEHLQEITRIAIPYHSNDGVVFKVIGDSLNKEIPDGFFVLVEPIKEDLRYLDKRMVVVRDGDGFLTCKQYDHTIKTANPCSTNSEHKAIKLIEGEHEIIGAVRNAFKNWGV